MATYSTYINGTYGQPQKKFFIDDRKRQFILSKTVNFANQNLDAGNADVLKVLSIPPETYVKEVWLEIVSACAANTTCDIGDGTDVDFFGNGMPMDHATTYVPTSLTASETYNAGSLDPGEKTYNDITVNGAAIGDYVVVTHGVDVTDLLITGTVTAANTATIVLANNADTVYTFSSTWNPASMLDGGDTNVAVTVTGAALGDFVISSLSVNASNVIVTSYVSATNEVTLNLQNERGYPVNLATTTVKHRVISAGSAVDLASATMEVDVIKSKAALSGGKYYRYADTIDLKATTDTADVNITTGTVTLRALCYDFYRID